MTCIAAFVAALIIAFALAHHVKFAARQFHDSPRKVEPTRLAPQPRVEPQRNLDIAPGDAKTLNQAVPIVATELATARGFRFVGDPTAHSRALDCLAAASWYEAGDDLVGERAVAQVVLNRARHPAFPASICGVVFQGSERSTGCQFTFTCDGALAKLPSHAAWVRARKVADAALNGFVDRSVGTATHYHADYVVPYWRSSLAKIAQVGVHLFYRWPGYWGSPAVLGRRAAIDEPVIPALGLLSPAHLVVGVTPAPVGLTPAATAIAPVRPPISLDGVREKSLRGAVVRGQSGSDQYFIQVDPAAFPGNYATAAVAICKGKPNCVVLAWRDPAKMASALPLSAEQRQALTFAFVHDEAHGDRSLWNCAQTQRPNKAQCLPEIRSGIPGLAT